MLYTIIVNFVKFTNRKFRIYSSEISHFLSPHKIFRLILTGPTLYRVSTSVLKENVTRNQRFLPRVVKEEKDARVRVLHLSEIRELRSDQNTERK